ncbi:DMT family transporter [Photobacterium phosphoreum]|jgi:drug/metabolite transporter (DMT)-like permease|uniref:DMT family transporter n=1 Tax=Photobacterium phosphoreum TaxID=659 RepID=UPI0007F92018|nr:DMT family transporter [Photobacterium phosphoreum]MCD9464023.1 EamA family transporter [Photobacterium phosphoreum]MCD9472226.1 EamA family transporter [Photobacterium phosphoreum]MCD9503699.1 EamA family transporter [Photobacterium phosphoreum]MCD9513108.1 EamA family transporter [Photobacterium phosphoreum]MCD9521134.1 EamA family transporter [Photobacterium phosphoreum]
MNSEIRPMLLMLVSTFSLSVTGLLAKWLTHSFDPAWLCFFRLLFPAILAFWLMMITQWSQPNKQAWSGLLVRGFCITACQLCFLASIKHLSLVEAVVLFGTSPLFVPILERIFFKTPIKRLIIINLGITFTGLLFIAGNLEQMKFGGSLLLGLAGGIFNAGSQVAMYRSSKSNLTPLGVSAWSFIIASLFLVPLLMFLPITTAVEWHTLTGWQHPLLLLLLFMAVCTVNTQVFRAKAYQLAESGSQLAPIIFTNLIFSAIWQFMFFNHPMPWNKMVGIGLIILATLLNTFVPIWLRKKRALSNNN